eukprot:CAMPEP_0114683488 /NCGR_PEP_ID=MMETSP0191-20121206/57881_1 /TAXON_ID=126664 /ORGANISM="Sorites sp." /LENGTH=150 /DNA_ID=CAMNT_0001964727 /DNA_START=143 /DNA_END=591 /DNA_ORIENTATION=+
MSDPKTVEETRDESNDDVEDELGSIIVDNGTGTIKAGFAGTDAPEVVVNNVLGTPAYNPILLTGNYKQYFIGKDLDIMRGVAELDYPMTKGVVDNFDLMETMWRHVLLMTEAPLNPAENRVKMIRSLFEQFNVDGVYIDWSAVLSLYSYG